MLNRGAAKLYRILKKGCNTIKVLQKIKIMKKSNLVLFATAAMALAGLVGCGSGKGDKSSGTCKHQWVDDKVITEATCTQEGSKTQKCKNCGETQTKKINKKSHDYEEQAGGTAATCDTAGTKIEKCKNCGDEKTTTIPAKGHEWENADGGKAATCDEAGTQHQKCKNCTAEQDVEIPATGHTWKDVEGGTPATCDKAGTQHQKCDVCGDEQDVDVPALGHKLVCDDDGEPAEAGKAKVRMYNCENGCGTTYFGFKASEVSEASKSHLVINDQGGARFWGRPIGNKMELSDDGSATARPDDLTAIFDETETGDFFEYVFDLTEEQVNKIGDECLLYCEAQPADYLGGQDFWGCDPSAEEWTPGLYIEGEKKGQPIEDYRYILYVDDKPVEFDPTMKAPVSSGGGYSMTNLPIGEYVMPYKFHLHKGTNKISLRMAGGYRSIFYNFTFRAEQKEEPVGHDHNFTYGQPVTVSGKTTVVNGTCECGKKAIKFDANDLDGKLTKGGKLPKGASGSYDGTAIARFVINAPAAGKADLYIEAAFDTTGNDKASFHHGKNGGSSLTELPDGKTNTTMKWNDAVVELPTTLYGDLLGTTTAKDFKVAKIAQVNLIQGDNVFTLTSTDSYGLQYNSFMLVY